MGILLKKKKDMGGGGGGGGEGCLESPSLALDTTGIFTLTACMHDVTYDVTDPSGLSYM